ncbi:MAG: hypothetical protein D6689_16255 [Deltaproteobacteria bacterium]|nr:MAG: hypothetical protein D6689_16255 [Deltaproteobacteria bacterium]
MLRAWSIVAICALPAIAAAQAPGQVPPAPSRAAPATGVRTGWLLGVGLGGGSITTRSPDGSALDTYDGLALQLRAGRMVTPRFAIVVDAWTLVHGDGRAAEQPSEYDGDPDLAHDVVALAGQWWVTPRLWLLGGVGRASYRVRAPGVAYDSDPAAAVEFAIGYEVARASRVAVDLQFRYAGAHYPADDVDLENAALAVGLSWY